MLRLFALALIAVAACAVCRSTAFGVEPALPAAPVPVVSPAPVLAPPAPLPPPPPPLPPPQMGIPAPPPEDHNGPLLHGDPLLDRPDVPPPGWFTGFEISGLGVHVDNQLSAPVRVLGVPRPVHVPGAELNWTGSPRFEFGYRFAQGAGEIIVAYRSLVTEANQVVPNFDPLGDGWWVSRLNLNVVDIDYANREFSLWPEWDMKWRVGLRAAGAYYDSRVEGLLVGGRVSNNFVGVGPHAGLDLWRCLPWPGMALFSRMEGAVLVGEVNQSYEETFTLPPLFSFGGATDVSQTQAVPVLSLQFGLGWFPHGRDDTRVSFGYQLEQWWYVGRTQTSDLHITAQGVFLRSEFRY